MLWHVILGLLRDGRLHHGYELMTAYRVRSGTPASPGNFYRELGRLGTHGYVETGVNPPDADARRIPYHITERGRGAFDRWLQAPPLTEGELSGWILFAGRLTDGERDRVLDGWEEQLWLRSQELSRQQRELAETSRAGRPPGSTGRSGCCCHGSSNTWRPTWASWKSYGPTSRPGRASRPARRPQFHLLSPRSSTSLPTSSARAPSFARFPAFDVVAARRVERERCTIDDRPRCWKCAASHGPTVVAHPRCTRSATCRSRSRREDRSRSWDRAGRARRPCSTSSPVSTSRRSARCSSRGSACEISAATRRRCSAAGTSGSSSSSSTSCPRCRRATTWRCR